MKLKAVKALIIGALVSSVLAVQAEDVLRLPYSTDLTDVSYWETGALPGSDNVALFDDTTVPDSEGISYTGAGNAAGIGDASWGFGGYKFVGTLGPVYLQENVQYIYGLGVTVSNAAYAITFSNIRANRSQASTDWILGSGCTLRTDFISAGGGRSYYTIPIKGGGTLVVNGSAAVGAGTRLSFDVSGDGTTIGGNGTYQPSTCDTTYGMVVGDGSVIAPGEVAETNNVGTLTIDSSIDGVPCLYLTNAIVKFNLGSGEGTAYTLPSEDSDQVVLSGMAAGDVTVTNTVIDLQNSDTDGVFKLFDSDGGSDTWVGLELDGQEIVGGFTLANVASASYMLVLGNGTTGEDGDIYLVIGELGEEYEPVSVTWTEADGEWDIFTTANWTAGSGYTTYGEEGGIGDDVTFDDTGSGGTITVSTNLHPSTVTVAGTNTYTFSGTGTIGGGATLTKTGSGTLNFGLAGCDYYNGTTVSGGSVMITEATAALGSGTVTLSGNGLISMYGGDVSASGTATTFANTLVVPAGETGTVWNAGRGNWTGAVQGSGTLNLQVTYIRGEVENDWSGFSGQLNVTSLNGAADEFRIGPAYTSVDFSNAKIHLDDGVIMYMPGTQSRDPGDTHLIGELSGTTNAIVGSGPIGGRKVTWSIGHLGTDSTFAGTIKDYSTSTYDGGDPATANLVKVGDGMLTLSGTNTYSGYTSVEGGTLYVDGVVSGSSNGVVTVATNAAVGGSGVIGCGLVMEDGAQFAFSATDTLTLSNSLTFSNTNNTFGADDVIAVDGWSNVVSGTYTLIDGFDNTLANIDTAEFEVAEGVVGSLQGTTSLQLVVTAGSVTVPDISSITVSGDSVVLNWESGTYNVLANDTLVGGTWDVVTNAAPPVSIPADEFQQFFKLGN